VSTRAEDRCGTCSDEGVEMRVLEVGQNGLCLCREDEGGACTEVMTDLVGTVGRGDKVLVHAGVAIARLA
jgi:hydrogenase maturation factor